MWCVLRQTFLFLYKRSVAKASDNYVSEHLFDNYIITKTSCSRCPRRNGEQIFGKQVFELCLKIISLLVAYRF